MTANIIPLYASVHCPSCDCYVDQFDMMRDAFTKAHTDAIVLHYGKPICAACADEHAVCCDCGALIAEDQRNITAWGEYACDRCIPAMDAEAEADSAHERQERHGWEQV